VKHIRLKMLLPQGEDTNLPVDTYPVMISAIDTTMGLLEIVGVAEFAALGFATSIVSAVVGQWLALGSGYAEAWEAIRADRMAMGFSYGVMTATDGKSGHWVSQNFGETHAEYGYDFVDGGVKAAKAFNAGLDSGYYQGKEPTNYQKKLVWEDVLIRTGMIGTMSRATLNSWGHAQWVNWYRDMGIAFRKFHLK